MGADDDVMRPGRIGGFSVSYRNPGHWDISTRRGREFRIRGEGRNVLVADERDGDQFGKKPREWVKFKSVPTALAWCIDELKAEIETE